jgi:hypothetical protein
MSLIEPRCKTDFAQHFIHVEGFVMPCCWIGSYASFQEYLSLYSDCADEMTIKNRRLSDIIKDPRFLRIEESWNTETPFKTCLEFCKKKSVSVDGVKMGNSTILDVY